MNHPSRKLARMLRDNSYSSLFKMLLMISLVSLVISIHSCSEDSTTSPSNPPVLSIGTLSVQPDMIVANVYDTLLVRLTAASGIYFTDSLAILSKVDDNNNVISDLGNLLDNGDLNNGDEIARDNIYSGKFVVRELSPGSMKLRASGNVNSNGTVTTQKTDVKIVTVYSELNSGEVNVVLTIQKNAADQLQTLLGGNPNNIETAANQLKTWLESQPGVASVEKAGSTSLIINYTNGLSGGMIFSVGETRGGFEGDTLKREYSKEIPPALQTIGENSFGDNFSRGEDNILLDANTIGNRNVLIVSPYEAVWVNNERPIIINRLNTSECRDYSVTSLVNQEATVSSLMNLTQYGYVVFATHGSQGKAILTGELVDTNAAIYKDTYKAMLQANRISIFKNVKISSTGGVEVRGDVYAIKSGFISNLTGTFPNTVILNNSCESTLNPDLANAFIGKGAKTYYGYNKVVNGGFAKVVADSITKRLAITGMTSGNAYFNASDPQSPNAQFQMNAGSNSNLKYSLSLINKDFEEGNINGWTKVGDGRVINRLGYLGANQGTFMGIISTGLGYTTASGSISQCFTVSNTESQLKLKWNFLSEEFLEYIGSQYQDYFKIKLIKNDGTEVVLFSKTVDQIAADFGATKQNPGQLIGVSPNIVFDRGGVFMTGWQSATLDITAYRGQTISIVFVCGDVGDSIYDTAILLDDVTVN